MEQLKTSLKYVLLFVTIAFITVSCQKEDSQNEAVTSQTQDQQGLKITMTTWQHFSEQNPHASQRIAAIEEQNVLARNTESELYGFVIDTSRVQIIEQEGFTTYAFSAIRQQPTPGIMENYLYKQNNDGTYQQYLLGYYCTVDLDGNIQYTADDLLITPIDDPSLLSRDSCYPEFVQVGENTVCTTATTCSGSAAAGTHTNAAQCECNDTPTCYKPGKVTCRDVAVFGWSNCPGGLPEDDPFDPSNPSNSGGTPTTTYTAPDGTVYTVLVPHPALYEVLTCINGSNGQSSLNDPTTLNVDAQMIATMNAYWKPMSIYLQENGCSEEAQEDILEAIEAMAIKACLGSFVFTDVGSNWQNAGLSNVNVQFVTIGGVVAIQNVHFTELHFGLPKQLSNGDYITNNNARYEAQRIMTQAEQLTDAYQAINPTATALQLKTYFLEKMQQISANIGGTVGTSSPLGWNGQLVPHQTYFILDSLECD